MSTGSDFCFSCRSGFHNECHEAWSDAVQECCCGGEIVFTATGEVKSSGDVVSENGKDTGYIEDGFESYKDIDKYKDPLSTGRKRAAQMYPIEVGMVCEWANLLNAGGGVKPIVGCLGRPASDRHHGPDKNTMNNAAGNVHRICDYCHNTWHAQNDPAYGDRPDPTVPFIPKGELGVDWFAHDSETKATVEQLIEAERQRVEDSNK
jgi:hypothetical protein